ncbi:MAG TPA: hypothetical protein VF943_05280 [Burkholderiales bacterium]
MTTNLILVVGLTAITLGFWQSPVLSQDKKSTPKQSITQDLGSRKYQEGLDHERAGRDAEAFEAFLQAGEAGHGVAQLKLANIYDRGNRVINRDYQSAIRWYERARRQGVDLAKPLPPIRGR